MDSPSSYQQGHIYTLETPGLIIEGVPVNLFHYKPDHSYRDIRGNQRLA